MAKYVETTDSLTAEADTLAAKDRSGLIVANASDTVMTVRFGAAATAAIGIPVAAGAALYLTGRDAPDASVSIFCAGTAKTYTIYEW
jgi:hypothetical protein